MDLNKVMGWTKNPQFARFAEERIDSWMMDNAHTMELMPDEFAIIHDKLLKGYNVDSQYIAFLYYKIMEALGTENPELKERRLWWIFKVFTLDRLVFPRLAEGNSGGFAFAKITALIMEMLHKEYKHALKKQKKGKKSHADKESGK